MSYDVEVLLEVAQMGPLSLFSSSTLNTYELIL